MHMYILYVRCICILIDLNFNKGIMELATNPYFFVDHIFYKYNSLLGKSICDR